MTGCVNRRGWDQLLAAEDDRCARHGLDAIVVALDLDGFKAVNDNGGHEAGDEMLQRCARILRGALRGHDVIARPGGDEFALLAVHTDASGKPEPLLERLRAADREMLDSKQSARLEREGRG